MSRILILTLPRCANALRMQTHLEEALRRVGLPDDYVMVNMDLLPDVDPRRGYGSPTVLIDGRDLFGLLPLAHELVPT